MSRFIVVCMGWIGLSAAGCTGRAPEPGSIAPPAQRREAPLVRMAAPVRPPRPLDAARLDALAAVRLAGYEVSPARRSDRELAVVVSSARDGVRVCVTVGPCLDCTPIDLPTWDARQAELAALWAPAGADRGDRLQLAVLTLAQRPVIEIDSFRTIDGETRSLYQLHWNDGATQLVAVCERAAAVISDAGAEPPARPPAPASPTAPSLASTATMRALPAPPPACAVATQSVFAAYLAQL